VSGARIDAHFADRLLESDEFYATVVPADLSRRWTMSGVGLRGMSVVQAVLPFRVKHFLEATTGQRYRHPEVPLHDAITNGTHLYNADNHLHADKCEYPLYGRPHGNLAFHHRNTVNPSH